MRRRPLCALTIWLVCAGAFAWGQPPPQYTKPLGIAQEEWVYPFPVAFLSLETEGQPVRMAYMDVSPKANTNGQTIVLLHGKNFGGYYWQETIRVLSAAGYRVVVPDQIGFGKSSKPDIHYSFDLLAAQTAQLLDNLKIDKAVVVGHSMGGMLAVRFARTFPERTSRLVLENPIGLEDYRFVIPPQPLPALIAGELKQTPEEYRAYVRSYFVTWQPERYEPFVEIRTRMTLSAEFPRWAKSAALTYLMIYQQSVRHEFALIKVPTLLIIGQADRTVVGKVYAPKELLPLLGQYPQLGRAAARDIPGSKLVEIPNVGHIPHLEAMDAYHHALLDFLK